MMKKECFFFEDMNMLIRNDIFGFLVLQKVMKGPRNAPEAVEFQLGWCVTGLSLLEKDQ